MKVKTLIKKLMKENPESTVEFCTASGSESGKVTGVFRESEKKVTLSLNTTHTFGEQSE